MRHWVRQGIGYLGLLALLAAPVLPTVAPVAAQTDPIAPRQTGVLSDLAAPLAALEDPAQGWSVLVVTFPGSEDFLQFSTDLGQITLDFPILTPRQQVLAPIAARFLQGEGIEPQLVRLADSQVLLAGFGGAESAADLSRRFAAHVFGLAETTPVEIELIRY